MSRPALLLVLQALVNAGRMDQADARALVQAYDDGQLPEAFTLEAPLADAALAAVVIEAIRRGYARIARAFVETYGGRLPPALRTAALRGDASAVRAVLSAVDRLPLARRVRLIDAVRPDDIRAASGQEAARRFRAFSATPEDARLGGAPGSARRTAGDLGRFQRSMSAAYTEDTIALARLGNGGDLTGEQRARAFRVAAQKREYVDRFAVRLAEDMAGITDQKRIAALADLEARRGSISAAQYTSERRSIAARLTPHTEKMVRARIVRESGTARALFFENAVAREAEGMDYPVERYIDRDTPRTCDECREARGYYLIGQAPRPGAVCRGGGFCQCTIEVESNRAEYLRLGGADPVRTPVAT